MPLRTNYENDYHGDCEEILPEFQSEIAESHSEVAALLLSQQILHFPKPAETPKQILLIPGLPHDKAVASGGHL
jgi:hypothetical protein